MTQLSDQDAIKAKIITIGKQPLPNGLLEADYVDHEKWTNKQWAWEFLRRRSDFIRFCSKLKQKIYTDQKLDRILKRNFGLTKLVSPNNNYDDKKVRFVTDYIPSYSEVGEIATSPNKLIKLMVRPGDLFLKFNLRISSQSKKYLDSQLLSAKLRLDERSEKFAKNNNIEQKNQKNRANYIDLIRLIDLDKASNYAGKGNELKRYEMYVTVFSEKAFDTAGSFNKSKPELQKLFSKKWEVAKEYMTKDRYLDLAATKD